MDPTTVHTKESEACTTQSLIAGAKSGVGAGVFSVGLYYAAMKYSRYFATGFNASARTALVVMPIFYTAWLNVEFTFQECMKQHEPIYNFVKDELDQH